MGIDWEEILGCTYNLQEAYDALTAEAMARESPDVPQPLPVCDPWELNAFRRPSYCDGRYPFCTQQCDGCTYCGECTNETDDCCGECDDCPYNGARDRDNTL